MSESSMRAVQVVKAGGAQESGHRNPPHLLVWLRSTFRQVSIRGRTFLVTITSSTDREICNINYGAPLSVFLTAIRLGTGLAHLSECQLILLAQNR
jgi:hypothetical protein